MSIALDKIVLAPEISLVAATVFLNNGMQDAITQIGAEDIAERPGTPLFDLVGRALGSGERYGGNGDDLAEFAGRQCYRSWTRGRSNQDYIANTKAEGHGSIFEHASVVFQVSGVSRSLTHELIRHRVGTAYSQESQRYVPSNEIRFVVPPLLAEHVAGLGDDALLQDEELSIFRLGCSRALDKYELLQERFYERLQALETAGAGEKAKTAARKRANEAARSMLPNAAETRLLFTTNLRAMLHIITLRGTEYADLEIRRFVVKLLDCARDYAPNFFADVEKSLGADNIEALKTGTGRV